MDPATHALTSLALIRGIFPRRPWWFVLGAMFAGTVADLDLVSALIGPRAFFFARHAFTHSIAGTAVAIGIAVGVGRLLRAISGPSHNPARDSKNTLQKAAATKDEGIVTFALAAALAAFLHLSMDLGTSVGVALFWPWQATRFAWDWLPRLDPWILALLLAGILLPELFRLVGSEIGTKDVAPRGRNGAIAGLVLLFIYVGARATLHGNAVAQLDAHTYRGELPRRLAAFADPVSLLNWHGAVETVTQTCMIDVPVSASARFDPENGVCVHKPEESPFLQAAQRTEAAKNFLQSARFPRASVGTMEDGTEVVIRDARDSAEEEKRFAVAVRILLDRKGQVTRQEILWASEIHLR